MKNIIVKWKGEKKVTDYFKFEMEVNFKIERLTNVEITQGVSFGEKIIVFGQQGLKDGTHVELKED